MLSTTTGGASQSTNSESDTADEINGTIAVESTSAESLKQAKVQVNREPFNSLSPDQCKTMLDEATSKHAKNATCRNNNNNSINPNISNANTGSGSSAEVGVGPTSGATSTSGGAAGGQNLTSITSIKSPANNAQNASSDHSNTNSNSSTVSASVAGQIVESDQSAEELVKKKQLGNRDEDIAMLTKKQTTVSGDKESQQGNNAKGSMTGVTSGAIIKEEPADLLGSLVNMKKEENFSPSMSPVGFGSLGSIGVPERSVTPVKMEPNANSTKASSTISLNNDDIAGCNVLVNTLDTDRISEASSSSSGTTNGPGHSHGGHCLGVNSAASSGTGSFINSNTLGSCLDYMQQQNHIFVFSTQLANKGAESVLSGQFQTIIAYHCTQPATKSFLEDFFMKNPMKINKLQRQNSMGLGMPIPNAGGQQAWHGMANNANQKLLQPQQQQKLSASGAKAHFNHQSDNGNNKRNNFADTSPAGGGSIGNEGGDLMCWETGSQSSNARNHHIEGVPDAQALKLMESVDSVIGGLGKCNADATDNNIISLQGVKVPDENLTPQQRQHREEQLAKIKKMNQFLFPENDKMSNSDAAGGGAGAMSNMMLNMSGGASNASQLQRQMQLQAQKSEHLTDDALMPISGDVCGDMGAIISCNSGPKAATAGSAVTGSTASATGVGVATGTVAGAGAAAGQGQGHIASLGAASGNGASPGAGTASASRPGTGSATGPAAGTAPAPAIATANAAGNGPGQGQGPAAGPGQGQGPGAGQAQGPSAAAGAVQGHGPGAATAARSVCSPGPGPIPPGLQCSGASNTSSLTANSPEIGGMMTVGADKGGGAVTNQDGMPLSQAGMSQAEWNKIQQQLFEERLKSGKGAGGGGGGGVNRSGHMPGQGTVGPNAGTIIHQPPVSGVSGVPLVNSSNPAMRNNVQGPPPPYHPTQRSASVPIATQSPNPSSPNNLSLPSPRTAGGALGLPSNSPSMEGSGNTSTTSAAMNAAGSTSKNCFQIDNGSPSSRHRGSSTNVMNHQLNSNPSTPLSHLSPKDLESFNLTPSAAELKSTRPSPQRLRSPPSAGNHLNEPNNMDSRFPVSSPGLNHNFNAHAHLQNNPNTAMNAYKGAGELNRQNCGAGGGGPGGGPGPVQFVRRSDNMPLNPNSNNRAAQNKMTQNFDPISSLAQMSQQLTSCVSSVGSPAGGMNMMGQVSVDMNMDAHATGIVPGLDTTGMVDQMNHGNLGNAPGNCHPINPNLMNPMGQRMLSPKICGLGSGPNGVVRDAASSVPGPGFHGILPPGARMMGRMPINFGQNFSPNIQVKASTPNTIQYMPVRSQNNNNNNSNNNNSSNNNGNNIRMPPSIEFLQRFANPQLAGGGPPLGHALTNDGSIMLGPGPMNLNSPNEQQMQGKMVNNPNINANGVGVGMGMNFFQNCNQIPGLDEDNAMVSAGLTGHEIGPMIRGMRPQQGMRQHGGLGTRMQAPTGANRQHGQFNVNVTPDGLECNDPQVMFNNVAGPCNNAAGMFAASQQGQGPKPAHHHKSMASNMCQTQVAMQGPVQGAVQGQGHPVMGGPGGNSNLLPAGGSSGPPGVGVNFVGPSSNDLKYAQQYHSFQQQLYATNTRSQQHQLQQQSSNNMLAMPPNLSPNPTFFVNK